METTSIFDKKFAEIIGESVKSVLLTQTDDLDIKEENVEVNEDTKNESVLSCSYCKVKFPDSLQQRDHYKLDWHRYNLKQSLCGKPPITEEEFDVKTGKDDLSSISGSDSEKEEDNLDTYATAQGKIFLKSETGRVFSLYRCLLLDRKEEVDESTISARFKTTCLDNQQWTILMLGGGHFAGAVFKGVEPILHKTFHCYTVRQGQGGSQTSRDNRGSQPKSAGASLRRYNEQALVQHVKSIVETWRSEIDKSSLIIYRASGPYNRSVLFGGSPSLLDRTDERLRTIPFSTRRATFTELKRVHSILSSTQIYDSLEMASEQFAKQKSPESEQKKARARSAHINRAKSRERVDRPLPVDSQRTSDESSAEDEQNISKHSDDSESEQECEMAEVNFQHLSEYENPVKPPQKKVHKKKKPKKSQAKKQREKDDARKKLLLDVLYKGDLLKLQQLLSDHLKITEEGENVQTKTERELKKEFINEVLDEQGNTLLHVTAMNEHSDVLLFLLDNDADPCVKNKGQHTAYTSTQSREIRETLRNFARENPNKHNYNKAHIPVNALTPEELADKKKNQRKAKREKEKVKKQENVIKRKEQAEKDRFLQLSDREKRALAAERRILDMKGNVTSRCFLCASDMAGKVPFEYSGNRFCTIECLKAHRLQHPTMLS
ncbi:ankyrin repeat and zinc finger domain-containing protein 1 isoform X1 [Aethina tumida]|uniref:ankyrin repeat and zinc finger domain-containing protein 1 isoform X1 n=1 Tax=Aethina tumida TaxID=116153 RepID=UPI00096B53C6|nr:ankyrin repeat and zinc finger domain-containing protein 1 isoform X1 [Aethina tumida]